LKSEITLLSALATFLLLRPRLNAPRLLLFSLFLFASPTQYDIAGTMLETPLLPFLSSTTLSRLDNSAGIQH
jgi:hypothetical protein